MKLILYLFFLIVFVTFSHGNSFSKVSPSLRETMMNKNAIDILVMIDEIDSVLASVTSRYTRATTHGQRAYSVHRALTAHAARTQESTLEFLVTRKRSNKIKSFWINNMISVKRADHNLIMALADRPEVTEIFEDEIIYLDDRVVDMGEFTTMAHGNMEWGIETIRAPKAWEITQGEGAVVGIIDTGARHTHSLINHSYMGNNATKFAWHNPYRPADSEPKDLIGHGTHVTGTIAGSNGIGVAPKAKWISCKGIDDNGNGTQSNLIACFQFMACPHHHSGPTGGKDCAQAPQIVSNSWGKSSGGTVFNGAIDALLAVNIWPVFAVGNEGPSCNTIRSPADSKLDLISVGATTLYESLASFSSRGPVRQTKIHPFISAPGEGILSAGSRSDTATDIRDGSSMACPHVSGVLALMASVTNKANKLIRYNDVKRALEISANTHAPVGQGYTCGGTSDRQWPNNFFGHGRIDAVAALDASISSKY